MLLKKVLKLFVVLLFVQTMFFKCKNNGVNESLFVLINPQTYLRKVVNSKGEVLLKTEFPLEYDDETGADISKEKIDITVDEITNKVYLIYENFEKRILKVFDEHGNLVYENNEVCYSTLRCKSVEVCNGIIYYYKYINDDYICNYGLLDRELENDQFVKCYCDITSGQSGYMADLRFNDSIYYKQKSNETDNEYYTIIMNDDMMTFKYISKKYGYTLDKVLSFDEYNKTRFIFDEHDAVIDESLRIFRVMVITDKGNRRFYIREDGKILFACEEKYENANYNIYFINNKYIVYKTRLGSSYIFINDEKDTVNFDFNKMQFDRLDFYYHTGIMYFDYYTPYHLKAKFKAYYGDGMIDMQIAKVDIINKREYYIINSTKVPGYSIENRIKVYDINGNNIEYNNVVNDKGYKFYNNYYTVSSNSEISLYDFKGNLLSNALVSDEICELNDIRYLYDEYKKCVIVKMKNESGWSLIDGNGNILIKDIADDDYLVNGDYIFSIDNNYFLTLKIIKKGICLFDEKAKLILSNLDKYTVYKNKQYVVAYKNGTCNLHNLNGDTIIENIKEQYISNCLNKWDDYDYYIPTVGSGYYFEFTDIDGALCYYDNDTKKYSLVDSNGGVLLKDYDLLYQMYNINNEETNYICFMKDEGYGLINKEGHRYCEFNVDD